MISTLSMVTAQDAASQDYETQLTHEVEQDLRSSFRQTYHEIADRHVVETDVIEQLRANLAHLEDLHGRMQFMMTEVKYLLKKS